MINVAPRGTVYFEIDELRSGINKGFAGYVGYNKSAGPDFEKEIQKFLDNPGGNDPDKRPTRINELGGKYDSSLSIVAEPGLNRYAFALKPNSRAAFDPKVETIFAIPTIGDFSESFITDIQRTQIGGRDIGSFLFDTDTAKSSASARAIAGSGHGTALKIPFYLNLVDTELGIPLWAIDDHRYHHHAAEEHKGASQSEPGLRTHGGIHPPNVASFIIVRL